MPRCGRPARRAVSRPVCADEKNPALSVDRKLFGTSTIGSHPARSAPAVAPHDPPRSADACRSAIGLPILPQLNTPGWTRTSDPGIRNFRLGDFASPEEIKKYVVTHCPATTCESTSSFTSIVGFTAHGLEKGTDLRNPQIGHPDPSAPVPIPCPGSPSTGHDGTPPPWVRS